MFFSISSRLHPFSDDLVLKKLDPREARVTIVGQKAKDKCVLEEKWYKTKYYYEKIEKATIEVSVT